MFLFSLFLALTVSAASPVADSFYGEWKLIRFEYRSGPFPLPNPDLNLRWNFFKNGSARLFWDRGTEEFCERFSHFSVTTDTIQEEVFAVNPHNAVECGKDPDMQNGKKTVTPFAFVNEELWLKLQLGDEDLLYVFEKVKTALPESSD